MKRFLKKVLTISLVYLIGLGCAYLMSIRVEKLESREDIQRENNNIVLRIN